MRVAMAMAVARMDAAAIQAVIGEKEGTRSPMTTVRDSWLSQEKKRRWRKPAFFESKPVQSGYALEGQRTVPFPLLKKQAKTGRGPGTSRAFRTEDSYIFQQTAEPVTDKTKIKELLARQISSPVRWRESMEELIREGVDTIEIDREKQ